MKYLKKINIYEIKKILNLMIKTISIKLIQYTLIIIMK